MKKSKYVVYSLESGAGVTTASEDSAKKTAERWARTEVADGYDTEVLIAKVVSRAKVSLQKIPVTFTPVK